MSKAIEKNNKSAIQGRARKLLLNLGMGTLALALFATGFWFDYGSGTSRQAPVEFPAFEGEGTGELLVRKTTDWNEPDYSRGDVVAAFNSKRILSVHAQNIVNEEDSGLNEHGLRQPGTLLDAYLRNSKEYKFERISYDTVRRVNLETGKEDILTNVRNEEGERIDVVSFLERRLKSDKHQIFGEPGREYWYGGNDIITEEKLGLVWDEIEAKTAYRRENHASYPLTAVERKDYELLAVDDFSDETAGLLVLNDETTGKRRFKVDLARLDRSEPRAKLSSVVFDKAAPNDSGIFAAHPALRNLHASALERVRNVAGALFDTTTAGTLGKMTEMIAQGGNMIAAAFGSPEEASEIPKSWETREGSFGQILVKTSPAKSESDFKQGDIVAAFNEKHILHLHAQTIVNPRNFGFNNRGLREEGTLLDEYFEAVKEYKFERISQSEVRRTSLVDGSSKIVSNVADDQGEYIDVARFLERRLKSDKHQIFGEPGREYWYGGKDIITNESVKRVWNEIEQRTAYRREDYRNHPAFAEAGYRLVAVEDFSDEEAGELASNIFMDGEDTGRRKYAFNAEMFKNSPGAKSPLAYVKENSIESPRFAGIPSRLERVSSSVARAMRRASVAATGLFGDRGVSAAGTVTTSIGVSDRNVDITAVTGSGPYTVTLASAATAKVGDALWDEHATPRKYLITAISGNDLTVRDTEAVGGAPDASATSQAQVKRYYSTLTLWEADLDDTGLYAAGDDAVGEAYNDSAFDEQVVINGGATVALNSVKLTVPQSERHDGTAGTGARLVLSSGSGSVVSMQTPSGFNNKYTLEWLEININDITNLAGINVGSSIASNVPIIANCIIHDVNGPSVSFLNADSRDARVFNTIFYNAKRAGTLIGIRLDADRTGGGFFNNTIYNVTNTDSGVASNATGIEVITNSANASIRNNILVGTNKPAGGGTVINFLFPGTTITSSNNLSDDATADDGGGSGHITNATLANIFVSTVDGSEDLHLKKDSPAIDAGADLGTTPTGVNYDIDGWDRDGMGDSWDIGADEYAVSQGTITTSIGTRSAENVNITAVSGSGPYLVTLSSAPASTDVGDTLTDEAATPNSYLVIGVSGSALMVRDAFGEGTSPSAAGSTQATTARTYSTIALWEADLDDTDLYKSGDDAVGEMHDDSTFTEAGVTINGGGTVGLASVKLSVAPTERHDGTAGTGARWIAPNTTGFTIVPGATRPVTVEWIEMNANGKAINTAFNNNGAAGTSMYLKNVIWHNKTANTSSSGSLLAGNNRKNYVTNAIVYNITNAAGSAARSVGIEVPDGNTQQILNSTVYKIRGNTTSGNSRAIALTSDEATIEIRNTIGVDVSGSSSGDHRDFGLISSTAAPTLGTFSNNISEDSTALGSNSVTGVTVSDLFVSTAAGSEDLHLKEGSPAIDAGTDLNTTPTDVNFDIDGWDREGTGGSWDIGADEYIDGQGTVTTSIGTRSAENVNITAVTGSNPYTVTIASATSNTDVGDKLTDEAVTPNSYLIIATSSTTLIVRDAFGANAAPSAAGASQATTVRTYSSITTWEAALDNTDLYKVKDDAVGEVYNDNNTAYNEEVTFDGGGTVGLNSITLTVPEGERHNGTMNSGARVVRNAATGVIFQSGASLSIPLTIEWLELQAAHATIQRHWRSNHVSTTFAVTLNHMLFTQSVTSTHGNGFQSVDNQTGNRKFRLLNSILLNPRNSSNDASPVYGISVANTSSGGAEIYNNTVYKAEKTAGSGVAYGIYLSDLSGLLVRNNIVVDTGGATSGTKKDYSTDTISSATVSHNIASDTTAAGTGSIDSVSSSDLFVSTTGGSEDLHLKAGADAIDAGTDLATTPTGVNYDIDNRDRDALGDTWDIGADEYTATGITISGIVYSDEGSTVLTSTPTVRIKVNGTGSFSAAANGSGAYSVSSVTVGSAGDVITVYLDGATEKAVTVTRATTTADDITGLNLYQNRLIVRHEDNGPITNANLGQYDSDDDADLPFASNSNNLTVADGTKLIVWTGKTFTPGGTVTTSVSGVPASQDGDMEIQSGATLSIGNNDLSVGGDFENSGTFDFGTQTTTFTATSTGFTIDDGSSNFNALTFNGDGGEWTLLSSLSPTGNVTVATGTLMASTTTLTIGSNDVLTVNAAGELDGGEGTIILSGTGIPFVPIGAFTYASSTVRYTGTSATVATTTYFDLRLGGTGTYTLDSGNTIVKDDFILDSDAGVSAGSGQLIFSGSGAQTITDSNTIKEDLGTVLIAEDGQGGSTSVSLVTSVKISSLTIHSNGELDLSGNDLTILDAFTNNGTFTASLGAVNVRPDGSSVAFSGSTATTTFYDFDFVGGGTTLTFKAGNVYEFTGALTAYGSSGNPAEIFSDSDGAQWKILFSGSSNIQLVRLKDAGCAAGTGDVALHMSAIDHGNNDSECWTFVAKGTGVFGLAPTGGGSGSSGAVGGGDETGGGGATEGGAGGSGAEGGGSAGGGAGGASP